MFSVIAAAVLSTQTIDGSVTIEGGDYAIATFEVPEGAVEIVISRTVADSANVLDFGVYSPDGFRGWGGGLTEDAIIGVAESSRGYLPGPLPAGTWQVVVGKAKLVVTPADYQIIVTVTDDATLNVRQRAAFADAALEVGARWYAGDLHVHSNESGDASASFAEIAALAQERGLDFVALSDHNTVSQHALTEAFQPAAGPLLMRGNEVTTYGGHGNALGAAAPIDHRVGFEGRTIDAIIADVADAGGAFIINHPALDLGSACIGCAWQAESTPYSMVTAIEIQTGPFALTEVFGRPARELWDAILDDGFKVTAVGGSDDHKAGVDLSVDQSPIGSPTTLVYADELSESAITAGIAAGRVVVLLSGPDDPRVELNAVSDSGETAMIGDTIGGDRVTIEAHVVGGDGASAILVVSGEEGEVLPIVSDDARVEFVVSVPTVGARYRVHVSDAGQLRTVTNHVFVDYVEGPGQGCGCSSAPDDHGFFSGLLILVCIAASRLRRSRSKR